MQEASAGVAMGSGWHRRCESERAYVDPETSTDLLYRIRIPRSDIENVQLIGADAKRCVDRHAAGRNQQDACMRHLAG